MPFTVPTFRTDSEDGHNFTLALEVTYWTQARGVMEKIILPVGAASDGASIPEAAWSIPGFQPFGPVWRGAWVHDCLYRNTAVTEGEPWTRGDADRVLLEWMQNQGMPLTQQEAIYHAVREFGQPAWDKGHGV